MTAMDCLRKVFADKKDQVLSEYRSPSKPKSLQMSQGIPAFVTFVTAGYPSLHDTVPIMLAMQNGGADVIELGFSFSDPLADGPAIQETNLVSDEFVKMFAVDSYFTRLHFEIMSIIRRCYSK
jgi:hypothetical protein